MDENAIFSFYDVYSKEFVQIPARFCKKTIAHKKDGTVRYALRGMITDGRYATKFIDKALWDFLDVEEIPNPPPPPEAWG